MHAIGHMRKLTAYSRKRTDKTFCQDIIKQESN